MGKDMVVEAIAVIKKNKKIQHERMRQGNARIIVIHPFVFGLIIFFPACRKYWTECIILLMIQRYLFWKQLNQFGGIK